MKTIVLEEPGRLALAQRPEPPPPGPGEVLVRVLRVGICGTDLHAFAGRQTFFSYPRVLGHELAVEVLAIGETEAELPFHVGDQCTVIPYIHCGNCAPCRVGKTNCCVQMQVLGVHIDGGMSEQLILPASKLIKAAGIALDQLAVVEMLCIGAHAVRRASLQAGETALVIGAGPIGLSVAQFAQLAGAEVMMMEMRPERLAFCESQLGISQLIDASTDVPAQLQDYCGTDLPQNVFDATGHPGSMQAAFEYVGHGGKLVLVGHYPGDISFSDPLFHSREMSLLASRNATQQDFDQVIHSLQAGQFNSTQWISHRVAADDIVDVFPGWLEPESAVIKAMLDLG